MNRVAELSVTNRVKSFLYRLFSRCFYRKTEDVDKTENQL